MRDLREGVPRAATAGLYAAFWHFAGRRRPWILGASSLLVGSQLTKLATPWLAAQAINAIQQGGFEGLSRAGVLIAAILAAALLSWALHGPGRVLERSVAVEVRRSVADALYQKASSLPLAWHHRHHSGDTVHRMNQTGHALYDFAQHQFVYLQNAVNFVGPVLALWWLSRPIGAAALIGYATIAIVVVAFDHALMRLASDENVAERRYNSGALDFLGNVSTVLSLRLQSATRALLGQRLDRVFGPLRRSIVLVEAKWCSVDLLSLGLAWALVALYTWLAQDPRAGQALLIGNVFMVYQYTQQAGGVIGSLAANYQQFARMTTNFQSARPIWDETPLPPHPAGAVLAEWQDIEIRDLSFAHGGDGRGLRPSTMRLRRGERLALVGPSGAGKSTLMRVLAGLYQPDSGVVSVDGERIPGLRHLGAVSTLIPQDAEVFEATVRENLTLGGDHDDEAIRRAAGVAAFDGILQALPNGLETEITERGLNLSGGQKQRLALARGVLAAGDSSIVMLDEPTSSLDPMSERRVFAELARAFPTSCLIASVHRLSLLDQFERIVLMVDGAIIDSGSADELLQRQPIFREMTGRTAGPDELSRPVGTLSDVGLLRKDAGLHSAQTTPPGAAEPRRERARAQAVL